MNDTQDPQNKPDYAEMTDEEWRSASESTRQTIIESLNDPVTVRAYLRYRDTFNGYRRVRKGVMDMVSILYPGSNRTPAQLLPDFVISLKDTIDPLARVIWQDVDGRIEELKDEKRETLQRLLTKAVQRKQASEIREDILDEI